ncbi:hypothetical protein Peur_054373 [Populus x canadensis]
MTTLARIHEQNRRRAPQPGSTRSYFDNTSSSYGWLLPGWVAEERAMESGRLYKRVHQTLELLYDHLPTEPRRHKSVNRKDALMKLRKHNNAFSSQLAAM